MTKHIARHLSKLTARNILSNIVPETLFTRTDIKGEYRELAKIWHPDMGGDTAVFQRIAELYTQGLALIADNKWEDSLQMLEDIVPGTRLFMPIRRTTGKGPVTITFRAKHEFELGEMYVGDHTIAYALKKDYADLFEIGKNQIREFPFADAQMSAEMQKFLPKYATHFETDTEHVLVVEKRADQLYLPDIMAHIKSFAPERAHAPVRDSSRISRGVSRGPSHDPSFTCAGTGSVASDSGRVSTGMTSSPAPVGHVAWILNVLLNISCYMQYAKITNNGIAVDNYFVSPMEHTGMIGSWWYSKPKGKKLIALPERSLKYIPSDIIRNKHASYRGDLDLIRAVGRELLGDITGAKLQWDKTLPAPLVEWLLASSKGDALKDYRHFKKVVVPACFGKPKYLEWILTADDLYGKNIA